MGKYLTFTNQTLHIPLLFYEPKLHSSNTYRENSNCIAKKNATGQNPSHRETILRMKVQRIECKHCGCIRQKKIHFVTGRRSYTNKFARYVVGLSRIGPIKDVALFLNISWDTVKDIQKRYFSVTMTIRISVSMSIKPRICRMNLI